MPGAWRAPDGLNRGRVIDIDADPVVPVPLSQAWLGEVVWRALPMAGAIYRYVAVRDDAAWVGYRLAEMLPLSLPDRQALLELDKRGPERNGGLGNIPKPRFFVLSWL